jgi:hypothetical protein
MSLFYFSHGITEGWICNRRELALADRAGGWVIAVQRDG